MSTSKSYVDSGRQRALGVTSLRRSPLFPEVHIGIGATVGSVIPTKDAIIPTAVGVDIGGGNHFIELCLDEQSRVWVMLHSGSRGIGNVMGCYIIAAAKRDMQRHQVNLPDRDLAYFSEGAKLFDDYVEAVEWAQDYALTNWREMMRLIVARCTIICRRAR